jgi:hypothetical protein
MPLPKSLKIGSRIVKILRSPPTTPGGSAKATEVGLFYQEPQGYRIYVAPELSDGEANMVLLHEVLHAVSEFTGAGLTERQVLALEHGLGGVARENPKAWSAIAKS